jgi:Uncharacterized protein conserved in bacteria (DUF2332)
MGAPIAKTTSEALARRFQRFVEAECRGVSALHKHLVCSIAADHELLALAAHATQGQPAPNLLLAAVHFLLVKGQAAPLAQFYPSLTPWLPRLTWPIPRFVLSAWPMPPLDRYVLRPDRRARRHTRYLSHLGGSDWYPPIRALNSRPGTTARHTRDCWRTAIPWSMARMA